MLINYSSNSTQPLSDRIYDHVQVQSNMKQKDFHNHCPKVTDLNKELVAQAGNVAQAELFISALSTGR